MNVAVEETKETVDEDSWDTSRGASSPVDMDGIEYPNYDNPFVEYRDTNVETRSVVSPHPYVSRDAVELCHLKNTAEQDTENYDTLDKLFSDEGLPEYFPSEGLYSAHKPSGRAGACPEPPCKDQSSAHSPVLFGGAQSRFSNFYPCCIHVFGRDFNSAEHAYQYRQAIFHEDSWDTSRGASSPVDMDGIEYPNYDNPFVEYRDTNVETRSVVSPHPYVSRDAVELCHLKNTAEQDTENYDTLDKLFSDDGLPEYVPSAGLDSAHKPSGRAGACPEPPCKAPKDQSSAQSPVLFGGAQSHFSNFYPCCIHVFGRDFNSAEHAYQYRQAIFHEDFECAEDIKRAKDARAAERVSKEIIKKHEGWLEKRVEVMIEILKAKAGVPEFREALLATGQAQLVEYVVSREAFWGVGVGYTGGGNMLGKLLMALRENLVSTKMHNAHSFRAMQDGHGQRICLPRQSERSQSRRWNENRARTSDRTGMFSRDDREDINWRRRNSRWDGYNTVGRSGKRAAYVERDCVLTIRGQLSNRKDRDYNTMTENPEETSWDTKHGSSGDYKDTSRGRGHRSQRDPKDMLAVKGHISLNDYMPPVRGHGAKEDYKDMSSVKGHGTTVDYKDMASDKEHGSGEDNMTCSIENYMPPAPSSSTGCSTTGNGGEMAHGTDGTGHWHRKKDIPEETGSRRTKKKKRSAQSPVLFGGAQSHFSNFYPCCIHVFGRDFNSAEHAYQYRQAIFHEDFECAEDIKRATDARAAKRVSKEIIKKHEGWLEKRVDVMIEVLKAKAEVPEFREALLATGQAELVEYVVSREAFWGVGFGFKGGGNMLGKLLMSLREEELISTKMHNVHSERAVQDGHGQRISLPRQSERSQSRRWNENRTRTNDRTGMFSRDGREDTNWRTRNSRWGGHNTVGRSGKKRDYHGDDYEDTTSSSVVSPHPYVSPGTVELCHRKSTAEEDTENYDTLDKLFSDDGLPEYVPSAGLDSAHKPSGRAGACPEPPCKAPKDQSSAQSPVLFGGAQSHFSNFYPCCIHVFGRDFNSAEHAYQYRQAMFHEDFECAEDIKRAKDARAAKRVSKEIIKKHEGWLEKRVDVMIEVLKAKAEVPEFREALLATGQAELVENVVSREAFWGVGVGDREGGNMLGKLLMVLREEELISTKMHNVHSERAMQDGHGQGVSLPRQSERSQSRIWNEGRTRTNDRTGMFSKDGREDTNWRTRNSRWGGQNAVGTSGKKRDYHGDDYEDRRAGYVEKDCVPTIRGQLSNREDRDYNNTMTDNPEEMSWDTKHGSREDYKDTSRGRGHGSRQDPKDMLTVRGHSSLNDYMPVRGHGAKEDYKGMPSVKGHGSGEDNMPCSMENYMPPAPSSNTGCSTTATCIIDFKLAPLECSIQSSWHVSDMVITAGRLTFKISSNIRTNVSRPSCYSCNSVMKVGKMH